MKNVNRDKSIEIDNLLTGQPQTIEFDYLVLATGAAYGNPIRNYQNIYLADRLDFVKDYQRKLSQANNVLVVGGGAAACEILGEIKHHYPKKHCGVWSKGETLLSHFTPQASEIAMTWAKYARVKFHLGSQYDAEKAKEMGYDFIIHATGYQYSSPFLEAHFSDCIAPNGQILVNPQL